MPTRKMRLLPERTVKFSDLPRLFAETLHDDEDTCAMAEQAFEDEFNRMVKAGKLTVRDPLTLGEQTFPLGNVLANSVLTTGDLRSLLEEKGISIETARQTYDHLLGQDFLPAGTYPYTDALHDIAQAQGWEDVRRDALEDAMWKDINTGVLPTYDYQTGLRRERGVAPDNTFLLVTPDDVNQWLESRGAAYRWTAIQKDEVAQPGVLSGISTSSEPPAERARRLAQRRDTLKKQGVRAWQKQIAEDENISTSTLKGILQRHDMRGEKTLDAHNIFPRPQKG